MKSGKSRTAERANSEKLKALQHAARSAATHRSYGQAVEHFRKAGHDIPASAKEVATYLADHAGRLAVSTLQHRLIAIHRAHLDAGHNSPAMDPLVKRTMQGIRRTYGVAQRRVKALVKDDLLEVLALVDKQNPMKAARDRALLLVGFAGAFRRSELVSLRIEDVTYFENGMDLLLRRSKTDQEGIGRTVFVPKARGERCPVKSLLQWLELYGAEAGPIFPSISCHDKVVRTSLSPQSVALLLKAAVRRAKGQRAADDFSAHSLRAGFVTSAAEAGLQPYQIREVTGHRSDVTLAKYIRPVQRRRIPTLL
jgi:integrase